MHWIVLITCVYLAAVVETSLADVLAVGGVTPDLLALVLIARLLFGRQTHHLAVSFAIGLIVDLTTAAHAGIGLAGFLATGWIVARYAARVSGGILWAVLTVLVTVSGMTFLSVLARQALGETGLPWSRFPLRSLAVGAYTAGFALPVFMVLGWLREPPAALRRA